jgi:hypothetical protein
LKKLDLRRLGWLGLVTVAQVGVLVFITGIGCGGGGGGGGGGGPTQPPIPPTPSGITFTADADAEENSIFLKEGDSPDQDTLVLEVRAKDVIDLYAVSLDLDYPDNRLNFEAGETEEGVWLGNKGKIDTSLEVLEDPDGTLVIGHTRLGQVSGRSGSGVLFTLVFTAGSNGSGEFVISLNDAVSSKGESMPDVVWISGRITVSV